MEMLVSNVLYAAVPILMVAAIALILGLSTLRRRKAPDGATARTFKTESLARITAVLTFVYGILFSLAALASVVVMISMATPGGSGASGLVLPVPPSADSLVPESVMPAFEIDGELVGFGYFSEVTISGAELGVGTSLLYFAPTVLIPLLHAIVAFTISALAIRVARQQGFAPELARSASIVGAAVIILVSLSQIMQGYGISLARYELLGDTELGSWIGPAPLDLTHVGVGAGLLLLAVLLHRGVQLERDNAGLV